MNRWAVFGLGMLAGAVSFVVALYLTLSRMNGGRFIGG